VRTWRGRGDALYASLILGLFVLETVVLAVLSWAALVGSGGVLPDSAFRNIVIGAVLATGLAVLLATSFVLLYHVLTQRRAGVVGGIGEWASLWAGVVFSGAAAPEGPLPRDGVEALIAMREVLRGVDGTRIDELFQTYRIPSMALESARAGFRRRRLPGGGRQALAGRLDGLEVLARVRAPEAFEPLMGFLSDETPSVRRAALQGLARTIAAMPSSTVRSRATERFSAALRTTDLPAGVLEDALILLGDVASKVAGDLLRSPDASRSHVLVALSVVGKMGLLTLSDDAAALVGDPHSDVRASAIRALCRLGYLPPGSEPSIIAALRDEVEFVRSQAVRALALASAEVAVPKLHCLLADQSWWVRRSAAQTLLRMGARGGAALEDAARRSPDKYARQMAVQSLLDAGKIDPAEARRMREAV